MSTLTKIVSLAKKLKKEAPNKFAKWTDYIKEASKKIKPVVKKAKKVAKKVTKKVKKKLGETHTDKNSHNVKLNIYSGTGLRKDESTLSYAKPKSKIINGDNILGYKIYKNHLIDIQKLPNGKKVYVAQGGLINVPYYSATLKTAKKFIDRVIDINNKF